ncbi:MAG: efflux RND transporter permease subunit [Salaquimonas sp.]
MAEGSQPSTSPQGIVSIITRHPNAANLIMVLMILFGVFALGRINTQFFPTIEIPNVTVTVAWSGASAEDVEANILQIIEPEVRFIDGVTKMESYSREGSGTISLEFERNADMQKATSDIDSAVKAISNLPEDAEAPKVSRVSFFDRVARISISGDVPEDTLRLYAKTIRDDLIERGIDKVTFDGMRDPEIHVDIPERELRRIGMSISDVSQKIAGNSRDLPSGQMDGEVEKQIRTLSEFKNPDALGGIEVKSFATGEKIFLDDIADIRFAYQDGDAQGLSKGRSAIQITVLRAPTADTLATAKILDDYLVELIPALPPGIELQKYDVSADSLTERILLLVWNGLTGLVIVVATLFIFLNARVAFWVAAGIPVAMLATIGFMMLFGQTINMISLFALIMMLGIIVDDAIVVGEHTATRFAMGDGPYEAAENGAGRMIVPVLAAMATTIAAFGPILLVRDTIGQIMGVMPIVVVAVLIASLIECFFILPGHLAHTLKPRQKSPWSYWRHLFFAAVIGVFLVSLATRSTIDLGGQAIPGFLSSLATFKAQNGTFVFIAAIVAVSLAIGALLESLFWVSGKLFNKSSDEIVEGQIDLEQENWFRRAFDRGFAKFRDGPFTIMVEMAFRWRYVTISISVGMMMIVMYGLFIGGGRLQFVFFPSPEAENINAHLTFNAGIPESRVKEVVKEVEASLQKTQDELTGGNEQLVSAVFTTLGSSGRNVGDNLAAISVQLTSSEIRTIRTPDIVEAWRKSVPKLAGLKRVSVFASRGGPPGRDIDLELTGPDVNTLKAAANEFIILVEALPGVTGVSDDLPFGKPELIMQLTPRGSSLGFSIDEVGRQIRNAFEGSIPRRFASGDDEIAIRVSRISRDEGTAALRNFEIRSATGDFIPLVEVVSLTERQGFSAIRRLNGKTIVSVTADLDTDILTTQQAIEQLEEAGLQALAAKYSINYNFGGRNAEREKSFSDLRFGVMIAMSIIYIILAWVFSSYFLPFAIMLIIPFGLAGAVFGHWLLGFKLTILSFIALLGLTGILVNDSIIHVSRMLERMRDEGETLFAAATGASRDRLRAVLLTSLTTIGGLIPLMFEKSVQAQFILPMAVTIIFGLAFATVLVLFLVPAFVGIGDDIRWLLQTTFSFGKNRDTELRKTPAE